MCEKLNYCQEKNYHSFREEQGYKGEVCPHCFKELQEEVINLRKKILELDEMIYYLNIRLVRNDSK